MTFPVSGLVYIYIGIVTEATNLDEQKPCMVSPLVDTVLSSPPPN